MATFAHCQSKFYIEYPITMSNRLTNTLLTLLFTIVLSLPLNSINDRRQTEEVIIYNENRWFFIYQSRFYLFPFNQVPSVVINLKVIWCLYSWPQYHHRLELEWSFLSTAGATIPFHIKWTQITPKNNKITSNLLRWWLNRFHVWNSQNEPNEVDHVALNVSAIVYSHWKSTEWFLWAGGDGCYSYVECRGGPQKLSLKKTEPISQCFRLGTIMHKQKGHFEAKQNAQMR